MRPNVWVILSRAVEEGLRAGWRRAHKHTDAPEEGALLAQMEHEVMGAISEVFEFDVPVAAVPFAPEVWVRAAENIPKGTAVVAVNLPPAPETSMPYLTYETLLETFVTCTGGEAYGTDTDCVRAALEVLEAHYGNFGADQRKDVLISHGDVNQPFSGPLAVIEEVTGAVALRAYEAPIPGRVHFFQGWRHLNGDKIPVPPIKGPNGHAGFVYAHPDGNLRVVSANIKGAPWVKLVTWEALQATYPAGVRLVVLP